MKTRESPNENVLLLNIFDEISIYFIGYFSYKLLLTKALQIMLSCSSSASLKKTRLVNRYFSVLFEVKTVIIFTVVSMVLYRF